MANEEQAQSAYDGLSPKRRRFVDAYMEYGFNATRAAIEAKYSEKTAYSQGHRLLKNVEIRMAIDEQMAELAMGKAEVLGRLAEHARGDIGDYYQIKKAPRPQPEEAEEDEEEEGEEEASAPPPEAEPEGREYADLDLVAIKRAGRTHLIKSIKWTRYGPALEMYDAQGALVQLGKAHGLFKDGSTNLNVDLSTLSTEQLERLAAGEDILSVLAGS